MSEYPDKDTDASQPKTNEGKTQKRTENSEGGTDMEPSGASGEDEGSSENEGDDSHLKENQKSQH